MMIGRSVLIRTVDGNYLGRVADIPSDGFVQLEDASRVGASDLSTGKLADVEPYPDGCYPRVNVDAIVEYCEWRHPLPR